MKKIFMIILFLNGCSEKPAFVMKDFDGLKVDKTSAEKIQKLENRKNIIYIWQMKDGSVVVDDSILTNIDDLSEVLKVKLKNSIDPGKMVIEFKADQNTKMEFIQKVHNACREANALKLSYQKKR